MITILEWRNFNVKNYKKRSRKIIKNLHNKSNIFVKTNYLLDKAIMMSKKLKKKNMKIVENIRETKIRSKEK